MAGDLVRKYYSRCTGRMAPETNNLVSVSMKEYHFHFTNKIKNKGGGQELKQDAVLSAGWW